MKSILPLAILALASSGLVHAEDVTTVYRPASRIEHVRYQAADLMSEAGIRNLRSRVRLASHRVCAPGERAFMINYNELRCFNPTVKVAMAQVDRAVARNSGLGDSLAGAASITVMAR